MTRIGFVVDRVYLRDEELDWLDKEISDKQIKLSNRVFSDEVIMCHGTTALARAKACRKNSPGFPGMFVAIKWLELI